MKQKLEAIKLPSQPLITLFILFFLGFLPFVLIQAICTLVGAVPFEFSGQTYIGLTGFFISILCAPLIAIGMSLPIWLLLKIGEFVLRVILKLV
jgi:hypothetical protein